MILEVTVNPPSNISFSDGDVVKLLGGKTGEAMIAQQHENLYSLAYRGKVFHGYSTTARTIPITSTTSPTFILWNPKSSGTNLVLIEYAIGYAAGTNVEGNVQLGILTDLSSTIATGRMISAFTDGPTINGLISSGTQQIAKFGTAATLSTAATKFYPLGMSLMQLAATNSAPIDLKYRFYGALILPPGVAVFTCASAATVATYNERITWYEYPA